MTGRVEGREVKHPQLLELKKIQVKLGHYIVKIIFEFLKVIFEELKGT